MKRLAILISVIWLSVFLSCLTILAGPSQIPHRDPASVPEKTEMDAILLAYASVLDLVGLRNYQSAQSLLKEVGTDAIPGELRYLYQRCSALGHELITSLDSLDSHLYDISQLITEYQLAVAGDKLAQARETIATTRQSLDDLEEAVRVLSERVAFSALAGNIFNQAYERVEKLLEGLRVWLDQLDRSRLELIETWEAKMREGLIDTDLSLDVNPSSVFSSENISITGRLKDEEGNLGGRDIVLHLGEHSQLVSTRPDGSYSQEMIIPTDSYTDNLTVMAVYLVSGDDLGTYLSSQSPSVTIEVDYYRIQLELTAPQRVFPRVAFPVSGWISAERMPRFWTVSVLWDSLQLVEKVVMDEFNIDVMPPSLSSMGEHTLEVRVLPEGRYGGISRSLPIELLPASLSAEIEAPRIAFIPQLIEVSGSVEHEFGTLQDATVNLVFMDKVTTVKTEADGSFRVSMLAPLDISVIGPQEIDIIISPDESWLDPLKVEKSLITVSPTIMGFLVLLSVVFMVWLIMRPPGLAVPVSPEGMVLSEPLGSETVAVTPVSSVDLSGIRSEVLPSYFNAVEIVTRVSQISPEPYTTLREYLLAVSRLPGGYKAFSELTVLAEFVLYSSHVLEEESSRRAVQLLNNIEEELESDAP